MNLNPIDFDYIDGTNIYPLQDYIDDKISSNNIIVNSNINEYIINNGYSSNININDSNKISDVLYFNTNSNLYLKNSNANGEIRFSTFINYPDNSNFDYGTKIDYFGKLHVYHNYNILQPTYSSGWYNVSDEILQLKADGINTDAQLTLLDAGVLFLTNENTNAVNKIIDLEAFQKVMTNSYGQGETYEAFRDILFSGNSPIARTATRQAYDLIKFQSQQAYQNSLALGAVYGVGIGIGGAVLGYVSSRLEQEKTSNALYNNSNLTTIEKDEIFNSNIQSNILNISNFYYETCNLSRFQGYVNSNILNPQLIPKIKSNEITLNNKAITKFSLESLDNWIKTTNGWYWDATNGNLGINGTPNVSDFLIVGGQTTIQGDLIGEKKLRISNTTIGLPTASIYGGLGDKLILREGGTSVYPYSIGINTNNMWYSSPTASTHTFYINASPITTISSTGLSTTGTINASTNLQENAVNLSAKYLQLSGGIMSGDLSFNNRVQDFLIYLFSTNYGFGVNSLALRYNVPFDASHKFYSGPTNTATISSTGSITASAFVGNGSLLTSIPFSAITSVPSYVLKAGDTMTGTLNGTTINASSNLQEAGTNLSAKYLKLDGTNIMTGGLRFNNLVQNKVISLYDVATPNNFQFTGLGTNGGLTLNIPNNTTDNFIFKAGATATTSTEIMRLTGTGNLGIGTNNPLNILQIGEGGRLRIANNEAGYTLIGTNDVENNTTNTSILLQGKTGNYTGSPGSIFYFASVGNHSFWCSGNERMRIKNNGNIAIGSFDPQTLLHIKGTDPILRIMAQGGLNARSQIDLSTYDNPSYPSSCSLIATDDGSGGNRFQINLKTSGNINNAQFVPFLISSSGNVGIGNNDPFYPLCIGSPAIASDGVLVLSKNNGAGGNRNFKFGYDTNFYFTMGDFGGNNNNANTWTKHMTIDYGTTSIGMGTTPLVASSLTIYDNTQIKARIILSGQEYYRAGFTSGEGLALFCGVNRASNKQLWIGNSANLVQNTAKAFVRISAEDSGYIDVTNGDGTGSKSLTIGGSSVILNTDTTINGTTTQNGDINVNNGNIVLANEGKAVYTPTLVCGGNTLYYVVNWRGTTHSGWFYELNEHFYSGHAYLTIALHAMNVAGSYAYCWFGRVLLSTFPNGTPPATNGGVISLITDYRNPASYAPNNNYISVVEVLDTSGHSALKISISNAVFGAQFKIKVVG